MLPLWIFSEGDKGRGLGHLSRCSAYAGAWRQQGGTVHWVVEGDELASAMLKEESVRWGNWQQEPISPAAGSRHCRLLFGEPDDTAEHSGGVCAGDLPR